MADTTLLFLVQWEDRYMSVIPSKDIVKPKKESIHYYEGELIQAVFQKKIYKAVISEIHPNRKYLQHQANLPPQYPYAQAVKSAGHEGANSELSSVKLSSHTATTPQRNEDQDKEKAVATVGTSEHTNTPALVQMLPKPSQEKRNVDKTSVTLVSTTHHNTPPVMVEMVPNLNQEENVVDKTSVRSVSTTPQKAPPVMVEMVPNPTQDKNVIDKTSVNRPNQTGSAIMFLGCILCFQRIHFSDYIQ